MNSVWQRASLPADLSALREGAGLRPLLRKEVASNGPAWLPLVLVVGALAAVAYADRAVSSVSLVYLYMLPLSVGAIFLRRKVSYGLIAACILVHDYYSPRNIHPGMRLFHNLSAMLCFAVVVYLIQRYVEQRETLFRTVQQQRDGLLEEVKLAAQVQRLFLPSGTPDVDGLEIAGMTLPLRGVGGDYYDYIPIDAHTIQVAIADVAGKGVPAALLMAATAASLRLEANHDRNMLRQVERLNSEIGAVSDADRYVTLLVAEIDSQKRKVRYVNCGHNSALLFRAATGTLTRMDSSCPPIGLSPEEICELATADLARGDVLVFYTDGVTEAENEAGEEFGMERLSAVVRDGHALSAEELVGRIFDRAAHFCGAAGFHDDVTIVVVKCLFDGALATAA
jgi:serine phosphatase RsbU (regulator of sigma subunit)